MNRILKAIRYAAEKHEGQKRKNNGRDYFTDHCMRLLSYVACDPVLAGDEDAAIVIICHDVVEDCTENDTDTERVALYTEIESLFGQCVRIGVAALTDEYTTKRYPELNRRKRKDKELERQKKMSSWLKRLKLYDRYANLQDMVEFGDNNTTYARESWHMGYHLSDSDNFSIAAKVLTLSAEVEVRGRA